MNINAKFMNINYLDPPKFHLDPPILKGRVQKTPTFEILDTTLEVVHMKYQGEDYAQGRLSIGFYDISVKCALI